MGKFVFSEDGSRFDAYDQIEIDERLEGKSGTGHTHAYSAITGKPATFPPSTHNHDDRYYTESESDARYKLKGDFAVITLKATPADQTASTSYPSGFNKTNCVVLSAMGHNQNSSTLGFAYGANFDSHSYINGAVPLIIALNDVIQITWSNIILLDGQNVGRPTTGNIQIKIVLMKV